MRRYLIRGGYSPLEQQSVYNIISRNLFGGNSGNLLYLFGAYRTLVDYDVEVMVDQYKGENGLFSEKDIDFINSNYDGYIVPLADAFRDDFVNKLNTYSELFGKLRIPVCILGVGLRAPYEPDLSEKRKIDNTVKRFVMSALNKSSCIGVRGEITGKYLQKLGFIEDKDYMVIGCPSMYSYGLHIDQRKWTGFHFHNISANCGGNPPIEVKKFIRNLMAEYRESIFIGQKLSELEALWLGVVKKDDTDLFPSNFLDDLYQNDRIRFFCTAKDWIDYEKNFELSIGSRLHGNIAGILGGIPTLFLALNARMRELIEYHQFPFLRADQIKSDDKLMELLERVDLQRHMAVIEENFRRYLSFLDMNGIRHIYKDLYRKDAPIDKLLKSVDIVPAVRCTRNELAERQSEHILSIKKLYEKRIKWLKDRNQEGIESNIN